MTKDRIRAIALATLTIFGMLIVLVVADQLRRALAPSDSGAAGTSRFSLVKNSPSGNPVVGDNLVIAIRADNTTGAGVAEIVIEYDQNVLSATQISEQGETLALNKNLGVSDGRATIDIARSGPGDLPTNTDLVVFTFRVNSTSGGSTVVRVGSQSTLGIPSILASNGFGSLTVGLGAASSSTTTTTTTTTSSSRSSSTTTTTTTISSSSTSSQVSNGAYQLVKISPSTTIKGGDTLIIGIQANPVAGAQGGEIKLLFDPNVLNITAISEESGILALNKTQNNSTGVAGVHIAKSGPGTLPASTTLVRFTFTVKNTTIPVTTIQVASDSKLGVPNVLAATGYGYITLPVQRASSSSSTTSVSTTSTSRSSSSSRSSSTVSVTSTTSSVINSSNTTFTTSTSTSKSSSGDSESSESSDESNSSEESSQSSEETSSEDSSSEESESSFSTSEESSETSTRTSSSTSSKPAVPNDPISQFFSFLDSNPVIVLIVMGVLALISGIVTFVIWRKFRMVPNAEVSFPDKV